uniref:Secreted protein n=1 Tax=Macrostomum lignano TaxID=282301 RepID=A0A1I8JPU4_9PLAT
LIVVVASLVVLAVGSNGQVFASLGVGYSILRMLHVDRQGGTLETTGQRGVHATDRSSSPPCTSDFSASYFQSYFVFLAEKTDGEDSNRSNGLQFLRADALWWGVI